MIVIMIDVPSPFAPLSEWEAHLKALQTIKPKPNDVARLIEEAKAEIAKIRGGP